MTRRVSMHLREEIFENLILFKIYICLIKILASIIFNCREKELAAEGRGLESMREKKEQREKECMMPRYENIHLYYSFSLLGMDALIIITTIILYGHSSLHERD